ncbi:MAG: hypothetical protein RBS34_09550, partial [Desulfofustis sp.]|nr:hypothetical protein [Desulfofustis sp.]
GHRFQTLLFGPIAVTPRLTDRPSMACCGAPTGLREAFSIDTLRLPGCRDEHLGRTNHNRMITIDGRSRVGYRKSWPV